MNPEWDFQKMGIGGLDKEVSVTLRQALESRLFPPEVAEQLGYKHVKGILLFGPPGTGKTLMARQIGTMLNAHEPKIVNGPEVLDRSVGRSKANIRRLFADAEEEEERLGSNSGLHIIIFHAIDAICKSRGSEADSTGVNDAAVYELMARMDQLNNILVIGTTNHRDVINEALLRLGRLEVQIEIGLPDECGRFQILTIHTSKMKDSQMLSPDVDIKELAALTKNFSGAELEGLVRTAQSIATKRLIKSASKVEGDPEAMEKLLVNWSDFIHALENIKPAFETSAEVLERFLPGGIINWGTPVSRVLEEGMQLIRLARATDTSSGLVSVLLEGPPHSGKTALAAHLAKSSDFPFVRVCSPGEMIGFTKNAKCLHLRQLFDDAYRSQLSCILVDSIEQLLEYVPVGPRFSNLMLHALLALLRKEPPNGRRLLILCTSSRRQALEELGMLSAFTAVLQVENLSRKKHLLAVLRKSDVFSEDDLSSISHRILSRRVSIGIKKLLALIDSARQTEEQDRVAEFVSMLEELGGIGY